MRNWLEESLTRVTSGTFSLPSVLLHDGDDLRVTVGSGYLRMLIDGCGQFPQALRNTRS